MVISLAIKQTILSARMVRVALLGQNHRCRAVLFGGKVAFFYQLLDVEWMASGMGEVHGDLPSVS